MSYADPQSITINAIAVSLPRTSSSQNAGVFTSADGLVQEAVSHQYGKRNRHLFRIDHSKMVSDPFVPTNYTKASMSFYIVADVPSFGYTAVEAKQVIDGFIAQMSASSGAAITKLLGGEN